MIVVNEDFNEMMPLDLTERTASINVLSSKDLKDNMTPIELQRIDTSDIQSPGKEDCRQSSTSLSSSVTAASTTSGEQNQEQRHTRMHSPSSKSPRRQPQKTQAITQKREVPIYIPKNWGCQGFSIEPSRRPQAAAVFPNQDDLSDISSCIDKDHDEDTNDEYHKSLHAEQEPSSSMVQNLFGFVSSVVVGRQPSAAKKNSPTLDVHDDLSMRNDTIIGKDIIVVSSSIGISQTTKKSKKSGRRGMFRWYQSA
mmetsp:Transcript_22934/g.30000  ORF Transcript_22934/g.30000 Transcript_22934/m.30000 type:complete len:253 (-) Transcript_22934:175-933(-)